MARVLVVEDEPSLVEVLTEVLVMDGYDVEAFGSGAQVLERLKSEPRPDLIVVDLFMPVLGGKALIEAIRKEPSMASIPVVISTGAVLGPDTLPPPGTYSALLTKPFDLTQFCSVVSNLI